MKVKKEDLKKSKVKLTIEIEPKELVKYFRESFEKVAKTVKIDGFRSGSAPFKLVEAAAGHNRLYSEGIDNALQKSYPEAVSKNKVMPISQPKVDIKKTPQYSLDANQIKDNFVYEVEVDVMPKVELKDYKSLKITGPKKRELKKADVEKILEHLQKQKATFKEALERGAKKGDRAEIDFEGFLKKVRIDKMCSKNFPMILGESRMIPGFEEKIIGMKKGEEKNFKIKFPAKYHDKELSGKDAEFKVKLNDLREIILPEVNKKFAENFGQKSVAELKKSIEENLKKEIEAEHKNATESAVMEKVLPKLKVELPESMIDQELLRMIEAFKSQVESQGIKFEQYLDNMKKSLDDLKKDMTPQAEKNIKIGFILGKIIEEKKYDTKSNESAKKAVDYLVKTLVKK